MEGDKLTATIVKPSNQGYRKDIDSPWMPKSYLLKTPEPENLKVYVTTASIKNLNDLDMNNKTSTQVFQLSARQVSLMQFFEGERAPWQIRSRPGRAPKAEGEPEKRVKPSYNYMKAYREAFDTSILSYKVMCNRKSADRPGDAALVDLGKQVVERMQSTTLNRAIAYSGQIVGWAAKSDAWQEIKRFIGTLPRGGGGFYTSPARIWLAPAIASTCPDYNDADVIKMYLDTFVDDLKSKKVPYANDLVVEVWKFDPTVPVPETASRKEANQARTSKVY